jgi:hypothetical protein
VCYYKRFKCAVSSPNDVQLGSLLRKARKENTRGLYSGRITIHPNPITWGLKALYTRSVIYGASLFVYPCNTGIDLMYGYIHCVYIYLCKPMYAAVL